MLSFGKPASIKASTPAEHVFGTALALQGAMLWTDFVVAFFMALLLSGTFGAAARLGLFGRALRSMQALLWIFLVILLGSWAGGLWIGRVGPTVWGISWVGFLLSGLGIALLAATLSLRKHPSAASSSDVVDARAATLALRPFIWAAAVVATFAIAAWYLR